MSKANRVKISDTKKESIKASPYAYLKGYPNNMSKSDMCDLIHDYDLWESYYEYYEKVLGVEFSDWKLDEGYPIEEGISIGEFILNEYGMDTDLLAMKYTLKWV
tara:strand:+ start:461 stop:772 length:312 start_codon:yes stop_codon:yes gene_type:complete